MVCFFFFFKSVNFIKYIVSDNMLIMCVHVFRGWQKDYRRDTRRGSNVYCWFVHNSGKGFIDGHYSDYIVPQLNSFLLQFWAQKSASWLVGLSVEKKQEKPMLLVFSPTNKN